MTMFVPSNVCSAKLVGDGLLNSASPLNPGSDAAVESQALTSQDRFVPCIPIRKTVVPMTPSPVPGPPFEEIGVGEPLAAVLATP